jgi:hypothetical protein
VEKLCEGRLVRRSWGWNRLPVGATRTVVVDPARANPVELTAYSGGWRRCQHWISSHPCLADESVQAALRPPRLQGGQLSDDGKNGPEQYLEIHPQGPVLYVLDREPVFFGRNIAQVLVLGIVAALQHVVFIPEFN